MGKNRSQIASMRKNDRSRKNVKKRETNEDMPKERKGALRN